MDETKFTRIARLLIKQATLLVALADKPEHQAEAAEILKLAQDLDEDGE